MSTESAAAAKRFDGRVYHCHCDNLPTESDLDLDINGDRGDWGYFTPDVFLVISSPDLMNAVQDQLRKHLTSSYKAESITIQLADSHGERGSEMISSNLSSRVLSFVNILRCRALDYWKEEGTDGKKTRDATGEVAPTQAGIRLYPKLPQVKNDAEGTRAKVHDLAVKYGAVPATEGGECRDVSDLDVTIKVNIFGAYNDKFYMNFRLVAPFRHKDKPEIVAEQPKKAARKRPASAAAGASSSSEAGTGAPAKKARAPATKKEVNPAQYKTEDDLCLAYVKSGMPLREAARAAMDYFEKKGEDGTDGSIFTGTPNFTAAGRAMDAAASSSSSGGAGAGSAAEH